MILQALESLEEAVNGLETSINNKPKAVRARPSDNPDLFGYTVEVPKPSNQFKERLDSAIAKVETILKEAS